MNFMEAFMSSNFFLLLAIAIDGFYAELDLWMRCRFLATLKKQHLETQNRSYFCHMHRPLEFYKGTKVNVISLKLAVVIPLTLLAILCSIFNYGHVGHLEKKPVKTNTRSKL
ncbi:hypothetical protein pdam_00023051 [Pocillopora damicornis]|uniref:Uncharacterized protein n=1 Tax=Pocillopora damicornis TaxID=46731 RepID=A0A3M6V610_POCDA|nr:hypothetical protein pdam_00023051 [Pocillopora damicornis]